MNRFVLPAVIVYLVMANNVNWGVRGIEGDSVLNNLKNKNISLILKSFLSENLTSPSTLPSINIHEKLLEKYPEILKLNDSFKNILNIFQEAMNRSLTCVSSLPNITELSKEIEKEFNDTNVVFKERCKGSENIKACELNFTITFDICSKEDEKETNIFIQNVTEGFLYFLCQNESDNIALFYSNGGRNCWEDKQEVIISCFNMFFFKNKFRCFEKKQSTFLLCNSLADLQKCVVEKLENRIQTTPANMMEALFNYVACKKTPCKNFKCDIESPNFFLQQIIFITMLVSLSIMLGIQIKTRYVNQNR